MTTGTTAAIAVGLASTASAEAPAPAFLPADQHNIGDSFASGHGGDTKPGHPTDMTAYEEGTIIPDVNECHRLKRNASAIAAEALRNTFTDASCAGAKTSDLLNTSQWFNQPPQIYSINPDAKLVTLQIGGNDAGFEELVQEVTLGNLTEESPAYKKALDVIQDEEKLPASLDAVYSAVRERAPNATVVVSLYDDILPANRVIPDLCPYITPDELDLSREFLDELNGTIRAAVARAGFTLVESTQWANERDAIGLSRDACSISAAAAAWSALRFKEPDPSSTNFGMHPTEATQYHQASKILAAVS